MRQARSVELVAQRRRMELFMRSQVRLHFAAGVFPIAFLPGEQCQGTGMCCRLAQVRLSKFLFLLHYKVPFIAGLF